MNRRAFLGMLGLIGCAKEDFKPQMSKVFHSIISSSSTWTRQTEYNGLVSLWPLSANGFDYGGGDHNGALSNITYTTGKIGNSSVFNGSNSYFMAPTSSRLSFGDGVSDSPFSWSFWIYPTTFGTFKYIVCKQGNVSGSATVNMEYFIYCNATGKVEFWIGSGGLNLTNYLAIRSVGSVILNTWNFVVCTYDGTGTSSGLEIYIGRDGTDLTPTLEPKTDISNGTYVSMVASESRLTIGSTSWTPGQNVFTGRINYVSLFSSELQQSQINSLYSSGSGLVYNYNENHVLFKDLYELNYILLAVNGVYRFASDVNTGGTNLKYSSDSGQSWTDYNWGVQYSGGIIYDKTVDFAYLFSDGSLIFSCTNKLYRSADGLATAPSVIVPKNTDGSDYIVHTPANVARPGSYFSTGPMESDAEADDFLVWSNYSNVVTANIGVAPTIVWYTIDKGITVKALYKFGQNTLYRDDGSAGGSSSTGTILGDASNPIICRHSHNTYRNGQYEWYTCTGDNANEVHYIKHVYTPGTDSWTNTQISGITNDTEWQNAGIVFDSGVGYWNSDNATDPSLHGLFRANVSDLGVSFTKIADTYRQSFDTHISHTGNWVFVVFNSLQLKIGIARPLNGLYGYGQISYYEVSGTLSSTYYGKIKSMGSGYYAINVGILWNQPVKTLVIKI